MINKFCSQCGAALKHDASYCGLCGANSQAVTQSDASSKIVKTAIATKEQINRWIMPFNAVVILATTTGAVVLDVIRPFGPFLTVFAILVVLAVLSILLIRLIQPQKLPKLLRRAPFFQPTVIVWKDKQLLVLIVFAAALSFFATTSAAAKAQGGALASSSAFIRDLQQSFEPLEKRLNEMAAQQRVANVLVQQSNVLLGEVVTNSAAAKKETSDDPRKELANIGVLWERSKYAAAARDGDARVAALFLRGGMQPDAEVLLAVMKGPLEAYQADFIKSTSSAQPVHCKMVRDKFQNPSEPLPPKTSWSAYRVACPPAQNAESQLRDLGARVSWHIKEVENKLLYRSQLERQKELWIYAQATAIDLKSACLTYIKHMRDNVKGYVGMSEYVPAWSEDHCNNI